MYQDARVFTFCSRRLKCVKIKRHMFQDWQKKFRLFFPRSLALLSIFSGKKSRPCFHRATKAFAGKKTVLNQFRVLIPREMVHHIPVLFYHVRGNDGGENEMRGKTRQIVGKNSGESEETFKLREELSSQSRKMWPEISRGGKRKRTRIFESRLQFRMC